MNVYLFYHDEKKMEKAYCTRTLSQDEYKIHSASKMHDEDVFFVQTKLIKKHYGSTNKENNVFLIYRLITIAVKESFDVEELCRKKNEIIREGCNLAKAAKKNIYIQVVIVHISGNYNINLRCQGCFCTLNNILTLH